MSERWRDISRDAYRALRARPDAWRDAVADVAARHGLAAGTIVALGGSNLVAAVGDATVVKIYPPFLRDQWKAERRALPAVNGRIGVATPAPLHEGEIDGWTYLVMTRVDGAPFAEAFAAAGEDERVDLLEQIGALIGEVQRASPAALAPWDALVPGQLAGYEARHARLGLPPALLAGLRPYVDRALARGALPAGYPPVLLTGEYTPENLLVRRAGGRWAIAALLDFGDAMVGPAEYDLLGPSTFLGAGRPARVRALLRGAGAALTPALRERLMLLLILHRHGDLDVQIAIDGWRDAPSVDALAELIWPEGV